MWTFKSLPLPPSANGLHDATHRTVWRKDKAGRAYQTKAYGKKNSKEYQAFLDHCELLARHVQIHNPQTIKDIQSKILKGYMLHVDFYFVVHKPRILTKDGFAMSFDVDNRLKPMLDGFKRIIQTDDKHFFKCTEEKISTDTKESECTIAILKIMHPRNLNQLLTSL